MKTVTITETKNRLSALLDQVRAGATILILDRGRPVARLEPAVGRDGETGEGRLARLERQGLLRRGSGDSIGSILSEPPPATKGGVSVVRVLLEDRRRGR